MAVATGLRSAIENNELHCTDDASFSYYDFDDDDDDDGGGGGRNESQRSKSQQAKFPNDVLGFCLAHHHHHLSP